MPQVVPERCRTGVRATPAARSIVEAPARQAAYCQRDLLAADAEVTQHARIQHLQVAAGAPVAHVPARKVKTLLAYLVLHTGQSLSRDRLAALLWEDSDDTRARHSLRQALHRRAAG